MTGAGDIVFDWDVSADQIFVSPEAEPQLGLDRGGLEGAAASWLDLLHPFEQDRYRACLDAILEQRRGRIDSGVPPARRRRPLSLVLPARPPGRRCRRRGDPRHRHAHRRDRERNAQERLLHDAVHDNLTGLPNRELFFDRLECGARIRAHREGACGRRSCAIDIDRFKQINEAVGVATGDCVLLTIARRLSRLLQPRDTLARVSGDHSRSSSFRRPGPIRSSLWPTRCGAPWRRRFVQRPRDRLFASIGIAFSTRMHPPPDDMIEDAEIAMRNAKRSGGNRIELFRPACADSAPTA